MTSSNADTPSNRKQPVSLSLDPATVGLIDEIARREQRTRSMVVRRAIRATYGPKETP